jgi:hypothetical protein
MAKIEEESKPRAVKNNRALPASGGSSINNDSSGSESEDNSRRPRERFLVSLNKETADLIDRLGRERGLGMPSTVIEFMIVNFAPWVLSADFMTVLADTIRSNRLDGPAAQDETE